MLSQALLKLDLAVVRAVVGWRRSHPSIARVFDSVLSPHPFRDVGVLVLAVFVRAILAERGFTFFWTCAASVAGCWVLQEVLGARLPYDVDPALRPFVLTGTRYRGFPATVPLLAVVVCGTLAIDDFGMAEARRAHAASGGAPGVTRELDGLLPPGIAGVALLALAAVVGLSRLYSGGLFCYQLLLSWALGGAALLLGDAASGWVPGLVLEQQLRIAKRQAHGAALSGTATKAATRAAAELLSSINFTACAVLSAVALGTAALRSENNDSSCVGVERSEFTRVFTDIYAQQGDNNRGERGANTSATEASYSEYSDEQQSSSDTQGGSTSASESEGAGAEQMMISPAARRLQQRQRQKKDSLYKMMKSIERRSLSVKHGLSMAQTSDASDAEGVSTSKQLGRRV